MKHDTSAAGQHAEPDRKPESGGYEPCRAQQKAAGRLKRPKPRKAAEGTANSGELLGPLSQDRKSVV